MDGDTAYFRRRASDGRAAAMKAAHRRARDAHFELVSRYDELANAIEGRERHLGLDQEDAQQSA